MLWLSLWYLILDINYGINALKKSISLTSPTFSASKWCVPKDCHLCYSRLTDIAQQEPNPAHRNYLLQVHADRRAEIGASRDVWEILALATTMDDPNSSADCVRVLSHQKISDQERTRIGLQRKSGHFPATVLRIRKTTKRRIIWRRLKLSSTYFRRTINVHCESSVTCDLISLY